MHETTTTGDSVKQFTVDMGCVAMLLLKREVIRQKLVLFGHGF